MEVIDLDDPNYVLDERLARRLKRRRLSIKAYELDSRSRKSRRTPDDNQLGDRMVENSIGLCTESRRSRGEEEEDDDNEDDTDPQYNIFLEKLTVDGKSYVLEVAVNNGMSVYMKYEAQEESDDEHEPKSHRKSRDVSDDEHEPQTLRKSRDVSKRMKLEGGEGLINVPSEDNMETELRNTSSKVNMEASKKLSNVSERERRNSGLEKDLNSLPDHLVSQERNGCWRQKSSLEDNPFSAPECRCQMEDKSYQEFLNCTKLEGGSLVLTLKDGKVLKYEEDSGETSLDSEILVTDMSSKDKTETQKNLSNVLGKEGRNLGVEKDLNSVPKCPVSLETNGCRSQKYSAKDNNLSSGPQVGDESYQEFLSCIKLEGDCIVLVTTDGERVKYEECDDVSSLDSDILVTDNASYCDEGNYNPFVTSRVYDPSMEGDNWLYVGKPNKRNHSQFREKLMSILRRPYDHREYDELNREIKVRKPMEGRIELRGGIKSYSLADKCSKSYLDHHSDLGRKIDAARFDKCVALNLLRGFFYWLKNLSQEGAFRPWLDTACLAVMPGNR